MAKKAYSDKNVRFSFILIPRIERNETIEYKKGKIVFKGADNKAEVWALDESSAHEILENLVFAVSDNVDPQFSIKLISPLGSENTPKHPSDPDWAYSRIPISEIPLLDIKDVLWKKILDQLRAFENNTWDESSDQNSRFLFENQ